MQQTENGKNLGIHRQVKILFRTEKLYSEGGEQVPRVISHGIQREDGFVS